MGAYLGGGKREVPVVHGEGARPTAEPVFGLAHPHYYHLKLSLCFYHLINFLIVLVKRLK